MNARDDEGVVHGVDEGPRGKTEWWNAEHSWQWTRCGQYFGGKKHPGPAPMMEATEDSISCIRCTQNIMHTIERTEVHS